MSKSPYPIHPELTAIALAYRNTKLIADSVLPRVPVGSKQEFSYTEYALADGFTVPETKVGRTSAVNKVEFSGKSLTASTVDYGLDSPIPFSDVNNSPETNIRGRTTEKTTDLILLDREVRAAKLVFNKSSYETDNIQTLTGTKQWNDPASTPIIDITNGLDQLIMRPNIATFGRKTASALRQNASVVKAYNGSMGDSGMVPLEFLRDLLELDEILIGEAWVNSAKPGQKPTLERAWGNHASFTYRSKFITSANEVTWGFTAETGSRISKAIPDANIGLRGGEYIRVGETVKELVCAKSLGFLFVNAVAG